MKKLDVRGCGKIFRFVLNQHASQKSYIALTLIVAALLFGIVFCLTLFPNLPEGDDIQTGDTVYPNVVLLCDATDPNGDGKWISASLGDIPYRVVSDTDTALAQADPYTVVVAIDGNGQDSFVITLLTTDDTALTHDAIDEIAFYAEWSFYSSLYDRAGIQTDDHGYSIFSDLPNKLPASDDRQVSEQYDETIRDIVAMAISMVVIFVMYFVVLFYGQITASSVMLEKTSKLMDFFLVSVSPSALMLGKVAAVVTSAILQMMAWIASAGGGWWIGRAVLAARLPEGALDGADSALSQLEGLFSPFGVVIALLCMLSGLFMYCGLAAVGGALASKPEDLSSTNSLFSMALVISYLVALFSGLNMGNVPEWLMYVPFTAILITPGQAIMGSISPAVSIASFAIITLTAAVTVPMAGRLYALMSFYRGDPPRLSKLPSLLKKAKKQ